MIPKLDLAWEAINALGGYVAPGDLEGAAFSKAIDKALEVIEELGGKDPAQQRARERSLPGRGGPTEAEPDRPLLQAGSIVLPV